ncbi:hypothetical protein [Paenibacillus silvae]|nr:hypothetical protein [Paenibacillus silvae]
MRSTRCIGLSERDSSVGPLELDERLTQASQAQAVSIRATL